MPARTQDDETKRRWPADRLASTVVLATSCTCNTSTVRWSGPTPTFLYFTTEHGAGGYFGIHPAFCFFSLPPLPCGQTAFRRNLWEPGISRLIRGRPVPF